MAEGVTISDDGEGLVEIVLDAGEGNPLSNAMADAIAAAVDAPTAEARVILLRAAGPDFCTGRAGGMPPPGTRLTAVDMRARISDPVLGFYAALRTAPIPVIAAVQGRAAGVGCAIAALADVVVAGQGATFSVPEMDRDIAPTLVMDALSGRIGRTALARLVLTRDPVGADEAKALGLAAIVADDPLAEARRIADRLRANSPTTVRAVKAFLTRAPEASADSRRELAALLNAVAAAEKFR